MSNIKIIQVEMSVVPLYENEILFVFKRIAAGRNSSRKLILRQFISIKMEIQK